MHDFCGGGGVPGGHREFVAPVATPLEPSRSYLSLHPANQVICMIMCVIDSVRTTMDDHQ